VQGRERERGLNMSCGRFKSRPQRRVPRNQSRAHRTPTAPLPTCPTPTPPSPASSLPSWLPLSRFAVVFSEIPSPKSRRRGGGWDGGRRF
jgi:hypothetical protein